MMFDSLGGTLEDEIEKQEWRKTKYIEKHEYILEGWNRELCRTLRKQITERGYVGSFMGTLYKYLDVGEYRYWCCGEGINRTDNKDPSIYFRRLE